MSQRCRPARAPRGSPGIAVRTYCRLVLCQILTSPCGPDRYGVYLGIQGRSCPARYLQCIAEVLALCVGVGLAKTELMCRRTYLQALALQQLWRILGRCYRRWK